MQIPTTPPTVGVCYLNPVALAEDGFSDFLGRPGMPANELDVKIVLRGTAFDEIEKTSDIFCPVVRRSPYIRGSFQHCDIVSCWKGISYPIARELAVWSRLFKEGLALQVRDRVQQEMVLYVGHQHVTNKSSFICQALNFFDKTHRRIVPINIPRMVHGMISGFYDYFSGDDGLRESSWSLASGDLPRLVYNFVRIQDCMLQTADGPFILFDIEQSFLDGSLNIPVTVDWYAPKIVLHDFQSTLSPGDECRINPCLDDATLGSAPYTSFKILDDTVTFSVSRSDIALTWNSRRACLEGQIPTMHNRDKVYQEQTAETMLCSKISTQFHGNVSFDRDSRHLIRMKIVDEKVTKHNRVTFDPKHRIVYRSQIPSRAGNYVSSAVNINAGLCQLRSSSSCSSCPPPSLSSENGCTIAESKAKHKSAQDQSTQTPRIPEACLATSNTINCCTRAQYSNGICLSKRKASELPSSATSSGCTTLDSGMGSMNVETKRQRLDLHNHETMRVDEEPEWLDSRAVNIVTGPLGEAHRSPTLNTSNWVNKLASPNSDTSSCKQFTVKRKGSKHTIFPWQPCNKSTIPHISSPPPSATASNNDDQCPANGAKVASLGKNLSQDEIKRNYFEFEERTRRKAAEREYYTKMIEGFDGVISPTDDVDRSFERIFLGDDTDRETDVGTDASEYGTTDVVAEEL